MRSLWGLCLFLSLNTRECLGFKWHLTDILPSKKILTFSERYMFASKNGPPMLEQGESYIEVGAHVIAYMTLNRSSSVGMAIYASADQHHHDTLEGICGDEDIRVNAWASNVYAMRVPTSYMGTRVVAPDGFPAGLNGTYYLWRADVRSKYPVNEQAWHNVAFQLCTDETAGPLARVDGGVTFRNPYGFIPAELYGFLPFEGARMVAYFFFFCFYLFFYIRHKANALPLHHATLVVVVIALAEATAWYAAYQTINLTGEPYCCPFPVSVVASLVLQIFRQTSSRTLLLVVSLGYGIVRPRLMAAEWVVIVVVTGAYFVSATVARVSEIILVHDVHGESQDKSILKYQVPGLLMDVIFLTWIYFALSSTIRILTEFQQTHKLLLFRRLATTTIVFLVFFVIASVPVYFGALITLPWQWAWVQQVLWECLNFAVLFSVCIICLPSDNSKLLSYASQLPQDDPDDGESGGPEMADEYDDGDYELADRSGRLSKLSLPGGDDDLEGEFGLVDED